jgi:hypothetical protein
MLDSHLGSSHFGQITIRIERFTTLYCPYGSDLEAPLQSGRFSFLRSRTDRLSPQSSCNNHAGEGALSVNPHRILLLLVQPLLALLLLAASAQAEPCLLEDRDRTYTVESALPSGDWIVPPEDASLIMQAAPVSGDDGPGDGSVLPVAALMIVLDQGRLIETSRAAYPTAPPSHRPCASPSTGPPLV